MFPAPTAAAPKNALVEHHGYSEAEHTFAKAPNQSQKQTKDNFHPTERAKYKSCCNPEATFEGAEQHRSKEHHGSK
jgi:hypothetical protein